MNFFNEIQLNSSQAEAIARGLFAVAQADGVHSSEKALVASFWAETGGSVQSFSELERREAVSAEELAQQLATPDLRRMFLKTALLLAAVDGKVSDKEKAVIASYAAAMDLSGELASMEEGAKEFLLSHLSHLQNTEAVAQVAKKLDL